MTTRRQRSPALRQATRWGALLLTVVAAWAAARGNPVLALFPAISPFVAVGSMAATRSVGVIALLALPMLAASFLMPRMFCRYACPMGLVLELLRRVRARPARPLPNVGPMLWGVSLAASLAGYPIFLWMDPLALFQGFLQAWRLPLTLVSALPALLFLAVAAVEVCLPGCWCGRVCPLGAMQDFVQRVKRPVRSSAGRRTFFVIGSGVAAGLAARRVQGGGTPPLRPPGAIGEEGFSGLCIRCGNCARVCPSGIIRPDLGEAGVLGLFAPVLRFDADYCRASCNRCGQACPSGAIERLSLPLKTRRKIGLPDIDLDTCLMANGRECTACIRACPFEALRVESLDGGFTTQPVLEPTKCNGCGACESVCPVRPSRAIRVRRG